MKMINEVERAHLEQLIVRLQVSVHEVAGSFRELGEILAAAHLSRRHSAALEQLEGGVVWLAALRSAVRDRVTESDADDTAMANWLDSSGAIASTPKPELTLEGE